MPRIPAARVSATSVNSSNPAISLTLHALQHLTCELAGLPDMLERLLQAATEFFYQFVNLFFRDDQWRTECDSSARYSSADQAIVLTSLL